MICPRCGKKSEQANLLRNPPIIACLGCYFQGATTPLSKPSEPDQPAIENGSQDV